MESWNKRLVTTLAGAIRPVAIPHLTALLVAGQVVLWMMIISQRVEYAEIEIWSGAIRRGEFWRLITFLFVPPRSNPIFLIFGWMIFFTFGTTLENEWGRERFNLYILIGALLTLLAVFVVPGTIGANIFIGESVLLAFAYYNPRYVLNIFFILPVEVRWLAWLTWALLGLQFLSGDMGTRLMVLASTANFFLFLGDELWTKSRHIARAAQFETQRRSARDLPFHLCATCGATERSEPDMQFLYCSKCDGALCYCETHIHTHEHVKAIATDASAQI